MIIKLSSRYGYDVYVNASNITFFKQSQIGTILFFGDTESSWTEVTENPETVAKLIAKGATK